MTSSFYYRYRWPIFLLFLTSAYFVVTGALEALKTNSNRVEDWLPASFHETQQLRWFLSHFGGDDFLMISWEGCTLDDPRTAKLSTLLRTKAETDDPQAIPLFRHVVTADEVLDAFRKPPLELTTSEAISRMEGWVIGPPQTDGGPRTCAVVVSLTRAGWEQRHAAVEFIYGCAEGVEGLSADAIHVAGSVVDSVAIDDASQERMPWLTAATFALCFVLMFLCFRSLLLAIMVFVTAVFSEQLSLALIHYSGSQMDSVMLMVPSLVYVLGVSSGVHLANYYRDAVEEQGLPGAPMLAVRFAWSPCWLASITTALGLVSLLSSFLVPVQKFGGYAAIGVLAGTAVLFLLFPTQLEQSPPRRWAADQRRRPSSDGAGWFWRRALVLTTRGYAAILLVAAGVLAAGAWGVTRIQTTAQLHNLFSPDATILQDYDWLEQHVGALVPVELVIRIEKRAEDESDRYATPMLDKLLLVQRIQRAAATVPGIHAVVSAATFAPDLPDPLPPGSRLSMFKIARRRVLNSRLAGQRDSFVELNYLQETPDEELWRVSARAKASHDVDLDAVASALHERIEPIATSAPDQGLPPARVVYTGGLPVVQKAQDQMLNDLIKSFITAFVLIAIAMVVLLRSVLAGLLAMVPNILPCVAVFGMLGWSGTVIEIGSMMTATAAMGIAVDDTLHFVTWFRRGAAQGMTRRDAIYFAYGRCGTAMVQTSLICGLGLLVFSLSPFTPISRFAWLMTAMLLAALASDLIVMPAILYSPAGWFFVQRKKGSEE